MLLRGFAKLVALIAVWAIGGLAIGTGLVALTGDDDTPKSATGGPAGGAATTATTTTGASEEPAPVQGAKPADDVRVRIVSASLIPAKEPSGRRRQRARLSVRVRTTNRGSRGVRIPRPLLVSADARVKTDPNADSPSTNLRELAAGATRTVTLRFEIAGAVTKRLRQRGRVRVIVAGRRVIVSIRRSA